MTRNNRKLQQLLTTIQTLRGADGCPWDRRQTNRTLCKYITEECTELVEAIENDDCENICEEMGDVLYLLLMLSEINAEKRAFTLEEVIDTVNKKLIRRHPHVFGDTPYESEQQLIEQWQAIKAAEKKK